MGQQRDIKDALYQLSTFISAWGNSDQNNETLPFVTIPNSEAIMENIRKQGKFETMGYTPYLLREHREPWIEYANARYQKWVKEAHVHKYGNLDRLSQTGYHPFISQYGPNRTVVESPEANLVMASWMYSPPPASYFLINGNALSVPRLRARNLAVLELQNETVISAVEQHIGVPVAFTAEEHAAYHSKLTDSSAANPHSFAAYPVHKTTGDPTSGAVAQLSAAFAWDVALWNLLPDGVQGIHVVLRNTCTQSYTYNIVGGDAFFLGDGDHHQPQYDQYEVPVSLSLHSHPDFEKVPGHCLYSMHIFPSETFQGSFDTNTPEVFAAIVASTFLLVAVAFCIYDLMQGKRNSNLINKAAQSNAIVTSLFPDMMRERLFLQAEQKQAAKSKKGSLKTFLNDGKQGAVDNSMNLLSKPMADLYLSTTVLMADISGFTAWSTVREPHQVFTLLESIYACFDEISKKRRICKVETVGTYFEY
ncbi:Guanylate cyclase [Seminavis robusta]|uniref:Guanylate cyclase n=1 Tax=Seminavis robusta TaxID=568900 RepID=A0A9N8HG53_9STRA|nr:Guanylate cyclase [Seminavis robusta]|eukprot:Sro382_g131030.1 Guanylate cyclase (477) ;mRNA; r:26160-27832